LRRVAVHKPVGKRKVSRKERLIAGHSHACVARHARFRPRVVGPYAALRGTA